MPRIISIYLVTLFFLSGCTYQVAEKYPEFLAENSTVLTLPETDLEAQYALTPESIDYTQKYPPKTIGDQYIVNVGKMLRDTLNSPEVKHGFKTLSYSPNSDGKEPVKLLFHIDDYLFQSFGGKVGKANLSINITAKRGDRVLLKKSYTANGQAMPDTMMFKGTDVGIMLSTKTAFDRLIAQFMIDLESASKQAAR